MVAQGEIVKLGCRDHSPSFAANLHSVVIKEETPEAFIGWAEQNYFRNKNSEPCVYPKYAWEVQS